MNDPKTGVYFHEKCLEISRLTADRKGEMSANHLLGTAYEKMVGIVQVTVSETSCKNVSVAMQHRALSYI